jgi:hypothetical protein
MSTRGIRQGVGREVGGRTFLAVNLAYETAMGAAVWRARNRPDFGWIVATMGRRLSTESVTWQAAWPPEAIRPGWYREQPCGPHSDCSPWCELDGSSREPCGDAVSLPE